MLTFLKRKTLHLFRATEAQKDQTYRCRWMRAGTAVGPCLGTWLLPALCIRNPRWLPCDHSVSARQLLSSSSGIAQLDLKGLEDAQEEGRTAGPGRGACGGAWAWH